MAVASGTVTFLFSDIEGSTKLLQRAGERWPELVGEHHRRTETAIVDGGGEIVDARSEEFFAVFGRAHDAVGAAVAIQRAHAREEFRVGEDIRVRIGLHSGEPMLTAGGYVGLDLHRAARICAAGHGRQILLSQSTRELVPDAEARDLGRYTLKGIERPERIFQLVEPGLASRFPPLRAPAARQRRLSIPSLRRQREPDLAALAWQTRARMPAASATERNELAELAAALFAASKTVAEADRYLLGIDRRTLLRQLGEYREMSLSSAKAAERADAVTRMLRLVDDVGAKRAALLEIGSRGNAVDVLDADAVLATATEAARAEAREVTGQLRRTATRGVYRAGDAFAVRTFDEVGIEHLRRFKTRREAHEFRRSERIRERHQLDYAGPSFRHGEGQAGQGGER